MKQAWRINPSPYAVQLTFSTNPQDLVNCDSDIWGRGLAERWVQFPEFLLYACKDFEQTPEGEKFLTSLARMTGRPFKPEIIYDTIRDCYPNPLKLVASRRFITSTFGVTRINNRYITAICVTRQNTFYVWYIIITHDSFLETSLKIARIYLSEIVNLIDRLLKDICRTFRNAIILIAVLLESLIQGLFDCLSLLLILIFIIIGGFIMPIEIASADRRRSRFRGFELIYNILDYLKEISDKLGDLEEINNRLTRLDDKVSSLNFNSISEITMQNINEINHTSLMNRIEELVRENERLELINNILQTEAETKDQIIARQKDYIEKAAEEIEQASKVISPKEDSKGKLSIEEIGELCKSLKHLIGEASTVINQTNNDLRESNIKGVLNIESKIHGNQTGNKNSSPQSTQPKRKKEN